MCAGMYTHECAEAQGKFYFKYENLELFVPQHNLAMVYFVQQNLSEMSNMLKKKK